MIGIDGRPWIDTDEYVDIERLKALELEIIKGICLTIPYHRIAVYGFTVLEKPNWATVDQLLKEVYDDEHSKVYAAFEKEIKDYTLRNEAKRLFTKMTFDVYSGGINVILRRTMTSYALKNRQAHCQDSIESLAFPSLMSYLDTLPFSELGRVVIFLNDHDLPTPIHRDGAFSKHHTNDFLWLSTNLSKKFFVYDDETGTKHHVTSHSAFFNEQDWHGSDPVSQMNFSIRVDGVFTPEFKEKIGIAHLTNYNEKKQ